MRPVFDAPFQRDCGRPCKMRSLVEALRSDGAARTTPLALGDFDSLQFASVPRAYLRRIPFATRSEAASLEVQLECSKRLRVRKTDPMPDCRTFEVRQRSDIASVISAPGQDFVWIPGDEIGVPVRDCTGMEKHVPAIRVRRMGDRGVPLDHKDLRLEGFLRDRDASVSRSAAAA
jgi:hypothetical protein